MKRRASCLGAIVLLAANCATAKAVERVSLEIFASKADVKSYPIEIGLPFPPKVITDASRIRLLGPDGAEVPCQVEELSRYVDGSLRAVLLVFLSPVSKDKPPAYTIEFGNGVSRTAAPAAPVKISEKAGGLTVDSGALTFEVGKGGPTLSKVAAGGREILPDGLRQFVQEIGQKDLVFGEQAEVTVEESGPVRAAILVKGRFGAAPDAHSYRVRIHAYAGRSLIRLQHTVLALDEKKPLELAGWGVRMPASAVKALCGIDRTAKELSLAKGESVLQDGVFEWTWGPLSTEEIRERSKKRKGFAMGESPGWRHRMLCTIGDGKPADAKVNGWVSTDVAGGNLAVCVRDFWQQYPKEISGSKDDITVWLHSPRGKPFVARAGTAKTHEILLSVASGIGDTASAEALNVVFQDWPLARVSPEWVCATGVFGPLLPRSDPFTEGWNQMTDIFLILIRQTSDVIVNRTCWYMYGNADFGDFYNSFFYNVPKETTRACTLEFLRGGDREWARLGARAARHYADIDVCHAKTADSDPGRHWAVETFKKSRRSIPVEVTAGSTHGHNLKMYLTEGDERKALDTKIRAFAEGFASVAMPRDVHQSEAGGTTRANRASWCHHTGGAMPYYLLSGDRRAAEVLREQVEWILAARKTMKSLREIPTFSLAALVDAHQATGDVSYLKGAAAVVQDLAAAWKRPLEKRRDYKMAKENNAKLTPEKLQGLLKRGWRMKGQRLPTHGYWQLSHGKHGEGGIILSARRARFLRRFMELNVPEADTGVDNDEVKRMLSECAEVTVRAPSHAAGCAPGFICFWAVAERCGLWSEETRKLYEERVLAIISADRKEVPFAQAKSGVSPSPHLKYRLPFVWYKWKGRKDTRKFVSFDVKELEKTYLFNRILYQFTCDLAEYGIPYAMAGYPQFTALWKQYHEQYLKSRLNGEGILEFTIEPFPDEPGAQVEEGS